MIDALKQALEKIATVNAMDYEYQRWAREALAIAGAEKQEQDLLEGATIDERWYITRKKKEKPMHPEIKKMYEDFFDKCFRESQPQRKPLTDEEIQHISELRGTYSACGGEWSFSPNELDEFVRAIESAHGIKE